MKTRVEKSIAKDQVLVTETSRDRSDVKPSNESLMGKTMKDTGMSRSLGKTPGSDD